MNTELNPCSVFIQTKVTLLYDRVLLTFTQRAAFGIEFSFERHNDCNVEFKTKLTK